MWFHRTPAAVSLDKSRPVIRGGLARTAQVKALYRHDPSFTDLLPWVEWLPNEQMLLHSDGQSVGIAYELVKAPIDGRSQDVQGEVRDSVQRILLDAFPRRDDPYVLQTYLQDERGLGTYLRALRQEMSPAVRDSTFTQHYLAMLEHHLARLGDPTGVFDDPITGGPWRARRRRVRAVIYRPRLGRWSLKKFHDAVAELEQVRTAVEDGLRVAGIGFQRLDGAGLYEWLVPWLNPYPALTEGDTDALLEQMPYPGDDRLPVGWDFAGGVLFTPPQLDEALDEDTPPCWWFDNRPCRFVSIEGLHQIPQIGHFTAERRIANQVFTVFDRLPEDTVLMTATVFWPAATLQNRTAVVVRNAIGEGAASRLVRTTQAAVEAALVRGEQLVSLVQGCFVYAPTRAALERKTAQLTTRLGHYGLRTVAPEHDPVSPALFRYRNFKVLLANGGWQEARRFPLTELRAER